MATTYSPRIVTDGLALCFDPAISRGVAANSAVTNLITNEKWNCFGGVPYSTSTNYGVLNFDTTNNLIYSEPGPSSIDSYSSGFTFQAFLKPDSFGGNNFGRLLLRQSAGNLGYLIMVDNGNAPSGITLQLFTGGGTIPSYVASGCIQLNSWQNIAIVYDSITCKTYRNGELFFTDTGWRNIGVSTPLVVPFPNAVNINTYIGNNGANFTRWYDGQMANYYVYPNKALSADEVRQNFNATKGRFGL